MLLKLNKYVVSDTSETHGHTYVQWSIALIGALVFVTVGFLVGWVSPMKKILQSDSSPTGSPLTDTEISGIATTLLLAGIIGVPVNSCLAEAYGRKKAILFIIALQVVSWVLKLTAKHAAVLIVARASAGIGYGGTYIAIPMYIREISQDSIKGLLGALILSTQHIGVLIIYAIGSYLNYYTTQWIALGFTIVTFMLMLIVPESPAFLIKIGKPENAAKTVATLRGLSVDSVIVRNEINYMKDENERYKTTESISFKFFLKNKARFRGILLSQALVSCVAFNGTFGIVTYAWSIMTKAGVSVNPELQSLIVPALLMFGTIVPMIFIERVGRKLPLAGAFVTSGLSLACLASSLLAQRYGVAVPGWVLVLSIAIAVTSYSAGVLSISTIIMIDMFRFQVRAKIMSPIVMISMGFVSVYLAIFDPISNAFGLYTVFFMSAGVNFLGALIVLVWLPETKGKTVDQIEAMLVCDKSEPALQATSDGDIASCNDRNMVKIVSQI